MTENQLRKLAKGLKIRRLSENPMMDRVAVVLNSEPTYGEIETLRQIVAHIEASGFKIVEQGPL